MQETTDARKKLKIVYKLIIIECRIETICLTILFFHIMDEWLEREKKKKGYHNLDSMLYSELSGDSYRLGCLQHNDNQLDVDSE